VFDPADEGLIHAALVDEILEQATDWIIGEGSDNRRIQPKAALQATGHVVLSAAFADLEGAGRRDSSIAWIEAQHDFAQADQIPFAVVLCSNCECHRLA
jgi:hypothetical protein